MSIFRKDAEASPVDQQSQRGHQGQAGRDPSPRGPAAASRERPVTRIAEGTRVTGEIGGGTELVVEGELDGKVTLDSRVAVGASGVVRGEISARAVLVAGRVVGDVTGTERVEVGPSGKVEGDITAPRVTIAEGAFFKGKVEMSGSGGGVQGRATASSDAGRGGEDKGSSRGGDRGGGAGGEDEAGGQGGEGEDRGTKDDSSSGGGAS